MALERFKMLFASLVFFIFSPFKYFVTTAFNPFSNIYYDFLCGFYFSISTSIPYVIDLIFWKKLPKWKNVFIYPLSIGFTEYILSFYSFSNNNLLAYSQLDNLTFLQIISLFGTFFLSFIIALFASILDYSIEIYFKEKRI